MTDQELKTAAAEIIDNAGNCAHEKTMEVTIETLADISKTQANKARQDRDIDMPHMIWDDVQWNGKGTPRGTLTVLDFGGRRVINFI